MVIIMKCLEDLSLVDDECLEDLQKDIKELIEKYINAEELCLKTFKDIRNKLKAYHINSIAKILYDVDTFWTIPICIEKDDNWAKEMRKYFDFGSEKDIENSIKEIVIMFSELSQDDGYEFRLDANKYWLFRDGANGEVHLMREESFLDLIEEQIEYETKSTQLRLLKFF
jgi:hypothetical protein